MTDQELIKTLRKTAMIATAETIAWDDLKIAAADRLEALLAEVTELKKNVAMLLAEKSEMGAEIRAKICEKSNLEREIGRLEAERDHFRDLTKKMWCEKRYNQWVSVEERLPVAPPDYVDEAGKTWFSVSDRFLAVVGAGSRVCEVSYTYPNREFTYRGKPITVSYWANLPEPPSTEGVE